MTWLRGHLLFLILCCICSSVYTQNDVEPNILSLRSGQKLLPETYTLIISPQEAESNVYYRYLQFYSLPSTIDKQQLRNIGIELTDYISDKTFLATFSKEAIYSDLGSHNIRSITPIDPLEKLAPEIDLTNPTVQYLSIQFHNKVSKGYANCILEKYNIPTHKVFSKRTTFEVETQSAIIKELIQEPTVLYIEPTPQPFREDISGNNQHYSNVLTSSSFSNIPLDGTGVKVAIGDDGFVGPHIDFAGRITENSQSFNPSEAHGDMVAGILTGAGNFNPQVKGVAPGLDLCIFNDFEAVEKASELYEEKGVVLTSTSYGDGCNRGYTTFTQLADQQINEHQSLMHVFSAGNAGAQDCGYGAGAGWGNITGGVKVGKNVIAVGNLAFDDEIAPTSSRGPANDGRIKPDICARGDGQLSTAPNNSFQISSGSSAAAPIVTGILAQLYHAYRNLNNNQNPPSDLMKGLLLNTADDLGNPGPDYTYGWGKVNALNAYQALVNEQYFRADIENDEVLTFNVNVPNNVRQLKLMLYWHDHEGSTVSNKSLVNDIDCWVEKNGLPYYPLVLNSGANLNQLDALAEQGVDHTNNMEQIVINNPPSGNYNLLIHGFNIPFGPQEFVVCYEFIQEQLTLTYPYGDEKLNMGAPVRIQWAANSGNTPFDLEFSDDMGQSWTPIATVPGDKRFFDWMLPENNSTDAHIRIKRNNLQSQNALPFHIYETPSNLEVSSVCADYLTLEWTALENASRYVIYTLKGNSMDSINSTTETSIEIPIDSPDKTHWYAISALGANGLKSMRTNAVTDGIGLKNCITQFDVRTASINSPESHLVQDCFEQASPVTINLKNEGTQLISSFPIFYQYDNLPPVQDTYPGSIPPGITVNHTFSTPLNLGDVGPHRLKVWSELSNDQGTYNDTIHFDLRVISSTLMELPYFENFDSFLSCNSSYNCEQSCSLAEGWTNASSEISDQLDWLPKSGKTNTQDTGPSRDQNGIDNTGKYLYLEPGSACFNKEAQLYSPCIDLTNSTAPSMIFWYHMKGAEMGTLHLDLFDGNTWWNNLINPIVGDQGDSWQQVNIDLSSFSGTIVNLRFRGMTGSGTLSDLAIDNISIIETATPPTTDFVLGSIAVCSDQAVRLIDNSYNVPHSWSWDISPGTFSFEDGSSANSQHPILRFHQPGTYSIALTTWNDYGSNTITKADVITVSDGFTLPYIENFNSPISTLSWKLENPDAGKTWEMIEITGKSFETTQAIYMNNHGYNSPGEEDAIISSTIDLTGTERPYLRFDLSYATFNQYFTDGLRIELSNNCQTTFDQILFDANGTALATAPSQMIGWTPNTAQDWKSIEIDLSDYIGQQIAFRFVNICGFGNNLYLDNIMIYEYENFPRPAFRYDAINDQICVGEALTFENLSEGNNIEDFEWSFDDDNIPTSSEETPGAISYSSAGTYLITLKASNALGWDIFTRNIEVIDQPDASFDYRINDYTVYFDNLSKGEASYLWDFGDGTQTETISPQHTFNKAGNYEVKLIAENLCGRDTQSINIQIKANSGPDDLLILETYPNPTDDFLFLEATRVSEAFLQLRLFNTSGQLLLQDLLNTPFGEGEIQLDLGDLPPGIYFLYVESTNTALVKRIVVH